MEDYYFDEKDRGIQRHTSIFHKNIDPFNAASSESTHTGRGTATRY